MKLVAAFFRMIRLPNLFFILLTQLLFQYGIVIPVFSKAGAEPVFNPALLSLLIISSLLIAAAGYIINDYFDINIDQVNKPNKNVVDHIISRRWAMLWHSVFSFIGVGLGFYVGWKLDIFWLGLMNFLCSVLLFVYSTTFKKQLLTGNWIIALLTTWAVAVVGMVSFYYGTQHPEMYTPEATNKIFRFTILYSSFAFIISLVREAVKDLEDMQGDERYGCRTMPIVWGINASKVYIAVWLCVLLGAMIVVEIYLLQFNWWGLVLYSVVLINISVVILLRKLYKANTAGNFHQISSYAKLIMLAGILSMILIYFYL